MKPIINKENVVPLFESKYINVFDLQYEEGKHYFDASRRKINDIAAVKNDEEFRRMLPDAVTCIVILKIRDDEPRLLLIREYRYPTGRFLLSPPAGLLDADDFHQEEPLLSAAKREILEETGINIKDTDSLSVLNPLLFSTPGLSDESNGLVCAVVNLEDLSCLTQTGAVGSECFDGFELLNVCEAMEILKNGRDSEKNFYSVYTWAVLIYFVSGMWK